MPHVGTRVLRAKLHENASWRRLKCKIGIIVFFRKLMKYENTTRGRHYGKLIQLAVNMVCSIAAKINEEDLWKGRWKKEGECELSSVRSQRHTKQPPNTPVNRYLHGAENSQMLALRREQVTSPEIGRILWQRANTIIWFWFLLLSIWRKMDGFAEECKKDVWCTGVHKTPRIRVEVVISLQEPNRAESIVSVWQIQQLLYS